MSSPQPPPKSLPEPLRALLDLFQGPLSELRFPDVDGETLAAAEAEVERRRAELSAALEVVQSAREALEQGQQALLDQARRAHAYASVYAQTDESLSAALAEIKLDGRALGGKKKRGRPRKKKQASKRQTSLAVADDAA